jgi:two-component system, OmpR family, response regulator
VYAGVPVQLVRWPAEAARRQALAADDVPRLLLIERGSPPPRLDDDEDWIWSPADERDLWARLDRLAVQHARRLRRPRLSDEGVLDYAGREAVVVAQRAPLLALLIDRFGQLVTWSELSATTGATSHRLARLRAALAPVGLTVHTIRGRGVLLAPTEAATVAAGDQR